MKRDRFASDYESIRRRAGLSQPEFPLDEDVAAAPMQTISEDFKRRLATGAAADAEATAKRKIEADAFTARANETARLRQFAIAGVSPPPGSKVSLSLLLSIGWTIHQHNGERVLVGPFTQPKQEDSF